MNTNIGKYFAKNWNKELVITNITQGLINITVKNEAGEKYGYHTSSSKSLNIKFDPVSYLKHYNKGRGNDIFPLTNQDFTPSDWNWGEDFDQEELLTWALNNQPEDNLCEEIEETLRSKYHDLIEEAISDRSEYKIDAYIEEAKTFGIYLELSEEEQRSIDESIDISKKEEEANNVYQE